MRSIPRYALVISGVAGLLWWAPWQGFTDSIGVAPGFREYQADGYRLVYPRNWQVRTGKDPVGNRFAEFNGPATREGAYSGHVRILRWERWNHRMEDKATQFRAFSSEGGYKVTKELPVTVSGAETARRFEVRTRTKTALGASVSIRGTRTFILSKGNTLLDLSAEAPEGDRAHGELDHLLKSVRVVSESKFPFL